MHTYKNLYSLKPYARSKGESQEWAFEINVHRSIKKGDIKRRVLQLYPDLKIFKINKLKTIKKHIVLLKTDKKVPWFN